MQYLHPVVCHWHLWLCVFLIVYLMYCSVAMWLQLTKTSVHILFTVVLQCDYSSLKRQSYIFQRGEECCLSIYVSSNSSLIIRQQQCPLSYTSGIATCRLLNSTFGCHCYKWPVATLFGHTHVMKSKCVVLCNEYVMFQNFFFHLLIFQMFCCPHYYISQ